MKYLVINADDFGLNSKVNLAIADCFKKGLITDASVVAGGAAFDEAVGILKDLKIKEIGVHLTVGARPACRAGRHAVPLRLREQVEKVFETGLAVTHLDGHRHFHMWPLVFERTCALAAEFKIPYVRVTDERHPSCGDLGPGMVFRRLAMAPLAFLSRRIAAGRRIRVNDSLWGYVHYGKMTKDLFAFAVNNLAEGITEIVVHPGQDSFDDGRTLLEAGVKGLVEKRGVLLVSYGGVRTS